MKEGKSIKKTKKKIVKEEVYDLWGEDVMIKESANNRHRVAAINH